MAIVGALLFVAVPFPCEGSFLLYRFSNISCVICAFTGFGYLRHRSLLWHGGLVFGSIGAGLLSYRWCLAAWLWAVFACSACITQGLGVALFVEGQFPILHVGFIITTTGAGYLLHLYEEGCDIFNHGCGSSTAELHSEHQFMWPYGMFTILAVIGGGISIQICGFDTAGIRRVCRVDCGGCCARRPAQAARSNQVQPELVGVTPQTPNT